MPDQSTRLLWPIPSRDADPFYDPFVVLVNSIDATSYGPAREDRNLILMGGGTLSFDSGTGVFSWSGDFEILSSTTGFYWRIPAGSITLNDGDIFYGQLVRAPLSSLALATSSGSRAPATSAEEATDTMVLAVRRGTSLYFRNGAVLPSGLTISAPLLFGVFLSKDIIDALNGANLPSAGNVFATMADIVGGGAASAVVLPNVTNLEAFPVVFGDFVRIAGPMQMVLAQANAVPNVKGYLGAVLDPLIPPGAPGQVLMEGLMPLARMMPGLLLVDGDAVYLSAATPGRLSNAPPIVPGNVSLEAGVVVDASFYNPIDPDPRAMVWVRPGTKVIVT